MVKLMEPINLLLVFIEFRTGQRRTRARFLNPGLSRSFAAGAYAGCYPVLSAGWRGTTRWPAHSRRPVAVRQRPGTSVACQLFQSMAVVHTTTL